MKNLITGANGFAASHLCDLLIASGEEVFGIVRDPSNIHNIEHLGGKVKVLECDIRHPDQMKKVLQQVKPDRIYHMASVSFVPKAQQHWNLAFETNVFGTIHLFESILKLEMDVRVMCVGSSEEYGSSLTSELPIIESKALKPITLYGVTKAAAGLVANSFVKRDGLDIICVRPFNHIGPRQLERFVCSSFAKQIVEIEQGHALTLKVGNLDAERDFMDVRDTVRAYKLLMEKGDTGGIYNVCSGKTLSIKKIIDLLKSLTEVSIEIVHDSSRFRPERSVQFFGDHSLLTLRTGWSPKIEIKQSLKDIMSYWKERILGNS